MTEIEQVSVETSQKTCFGKFEEWFFYGQEDEFRELCSLYRGPKMIVQLNRVIALLTIISLTIYIVATSPKLTFYMWIKRFSSWGIILTCVTFIFSLMIPLGCPNSDQTKKIIFPKAWKFYIVFFQIALIAEIIITIIYWTLIPGKNHSLL